MNSNGVSLLKKCDKLSISKEAPFRVASAPVTTISLLRGSPEMTPGLMRSAERTIRNYSPSYFTYYQLKGNPISKRKSDLPCKSPSGIKPGGAPARAHAWGSVISWRTARMGGGSGRTENFYRVDWNYFLRHAMEFLGCVLVGKREKPEWCIDIRACLKGSMGRRK